MEAFQFGDIGNAKERKPSGESISEKGPKKSFIKKRDGTHEEAEIQRKAFRHGKNLAFSKDT